MNTSCSEHLIQCCVTVSISYLPCRPCQIQHRYGCAAATSECKFIAEQLLGAWADPALKFSKNFFNWGWRTGGKRQGSLWLCCQMAVLSYCRVLRVQLTEVQASSSSVGTIMLVYPSFSLGILFPEEIKLLSFLVCFKISLFDACSCDTLAISTSAVWLYPSCVGNNTLNVLVFWDNKHVLLLLLPLFSSQGWHAANGFGVFWRTAQTGKN